MNVSRAARGLALPANSCRRPDARSQLRTRYRSARLLRLVRSGLVWAAAVFAVRGIAVAAQEVAAEVLAAETERVAAIAKASAPTVAVFDAQGQGGGSAVLISADGYALTNFHVTAPCGPAMKCGLPDGKIYDAVIVGVDPVGDVALIQLLGRDDFPVAEIANSDDVQVGDWCFAAGNPFLLADDFRPTITYGIVSGTHRYQYPAQTLLEYADCIQTDAAINPGNSGGPLFNAAGQLIGVNGRGSFEKRGRVNVGVGYAISINQIMRFLGHLKSGRIIDHASLGAVVSTQGNAAVVDEVLEDSDAYRRGLRYDDQLVRFDDRPIDNANALKNALGVYPAGWRTSLAFRRDGRLFDIDVRLPGLHSEGELIDLVQQEASRPPERPEPPREDPPEGEPDGQPRPEDRPRPQLPGFRLPGAPALPPQIAARYVARRGYANYWYNQQAQQRLWTRGVEQTGWTGLGYDWRVAGTVGPGEFQWTTSPAQADLTLPAGVTSAVFGGELSDQLSPPRSGGLLLAVHFWQRLLDKGLRQFGETYYLGRLPAGPGGPPADCLVGVTAGMEVRFYFALEDGRCVGLELFPREDVDPCEVWLSDFREVDGRQLPYRWTVRHGNEVFGEFAVQQWDIGPAADADTGDKS